MPARRDISGSVSGRAGGSRPHTNWTMWTRFVSSQPQYSMLYRKAERRVFPLCKELGIGQIVWSPLAQGVLTGKYPPNQPPPSDSRAAGRRIRRYTDEKVLQAVQQLRPIAEGAFAVDVSACFGLGPQGEKRQLSHHRRKPPGTDSAERRCRRRSARQCGLPGDR